MIDPGSSVDPTQRPTLPLTRRRLLQWSAAAGGTTGVLGLGAVGLQAVNAAETKAGERTVWSACTVNCGSRCPLHLAVQDGTVVRVDPDREGDGEIGSQQIRACVRGRSIRQRIYSPSG